uniref:Reverse transcriptase domain-containing protein n=1 Tax=Salarias fasciatus TaxID=181472 RepID=A0A672FZI9_SALFA
MHRTAGLHVTLDFNKAFDRVEHAFLWGVLDKMGFGQRFQGWIRLLYSAATSRIKCNGSLTDPIPVRRSIRQGCPLSAFLYSDGRSS